MPETAFLLVEVGVYILAISCLLHAWARGRSRLLALTIDLSMDAIAIRLGFWTWRQAGPWFGVPLGNFYAWFIVVFGFSLLLRLGRLWSLAGPLALLGDVAMAILAIVLSVLGLST